MQFALSRLVPPALLLMMSFSAIGAAASERPNVIVVMTDDQGYGDFSCHGNPVVQTPNIDELARESIRLTDFHVAPMCTPTRGQLMTGLDAFRNGACNVSSGRALLRPELTTMADLFRSSGYRTGHFGKWHLGDNYPFRPHDRGFDEAVWFRSSYIGSLADYWENDYFDDFYFHGDTQRQYDGYCTDVFFREAIEWMAESEDQPFFAYIPLNSAHAPWFVPDKYRDEVRAAVQEHPESVEHLQERALQRLTSFLAMGANIDENIGVLDRFLEEKGLRDNTILVFLTDNGSTWGPRYFNAGMRGSKTTLWEGGHRVPCFIRWPAGETGEPRDVTELCHVQDLLPTLADLAKVDGVPGELDGESLAPVFRGERDTLGDRMLVVNYSRMPGFKVSYTDGNPAIPQREGAAVLWKHWRFLEDSQLYDLRSDPHQDHDVADEHPEVVARMRKHLNKWWEGVKDRVAEPQRVVIGSEHENPTRLAASEWLEVFVDQQFQARAAVRKNGVWHLEVARPGVFEFEVSRFPGESGLALTDRVTETVLTDGKLPAGPALPIAKARLRVGDREEEKVAEQGEPSVAFRLELPAGPTALQTWLLDEDGEELCGAFYATVTRVE